MCASPHGDGAMYGIVHTPHVPTVSPIIEMQHFSIQHTSVVSNLAGYMGYTVKNAPVGGLHLFLDTERFPKLYERCSFCFIFLVRFSIPSNFVIM